MKDRTNSRLWTELIENIIDQSIYVASPAIQIQCSVKVLLEQLEFSNYVTSVILQPKKIKGVGDIQHLRHPASVEPRPGLVGDHKEGSPHHRLIVGILI